MEYVVQMANIMKMEFVKLQVQLIKQLIWTDADYGKLEMVVKIV